VQGVVGGVSPRKQANGQAPVVDPNLLSASTTLQQAGSGYQRLVDALQSLDQAQNIVALLNSIQSQAAEIAALTTRVTNAEGVIATLQTQVFTLQGQMTTANNNIATLQGQVTTLQGQLDGVSFAGNTGGVPIGGVSGNTHITLSGITYSLPLYVQSP
jgi:chromosome segregation ATPase